MKRTNFSDKKAAYYTLGCKLNFSETATVAEQLAEMGVSPAGRGERADIIIVNTCSVTDMAEKKGRQQIRKLMRRHPGARVIVTGCYAQLRPEEIKAIKGVDAVLGAEFKGSVTSTAVNLLEGGDSQSRTTDFKGIRSFSPSCSRGLRTRYFLKVQDGCDHFCTYCTIPFARGRSRNASVAELVAEAENAAAMGGREIVITGVNIGDFGKSTGEEFADLVRALDKVEGIERYRISSIEPELLTDEIIEFAAHSRAFMPHFHIPLQSGDDDVLKLMRRRYDTALFRHKVEKVKELMPDAFIGVDVMVGCRGETDECFQRAYDFIKSLDITQLHVFPYSERPGTRALKIDYVVEPEERKHRVDVLLELSQKKTHEFYAAHRGREAVVLMERARKGGVMHGFTDNYIRVELPADNKLDNEFIKVRLGDFNADGSALKAEII